MYKHDVIVHLINQNPAKDPPTFFVKATYFSERSEPFTADTLPTITVPCEGVMSDESQTNKRYYNPLTISLGKNGPIGAYVIQYVSMFKTVPEIKSYTGYGPVGTDILTSPIVDLVTPIFT